MNKPPTFRSSSSFSTSTSASLLLVLSLLLVSPWTCQCFLTTTSTATTTASIASASACTSTSSRLFSSTNTNNEHPPSLYEILGASPKDSDEELKRKWQQLARRLHPDANINTNMAEENASSSYPYALSDVNAAWGVLSDPKERRRYDRALQAQEFADTFEILLDAGIKTAIPFLRKTADGAVKLGEQSGKTLQDVSQKSNQVMNDVNKRLKINAQIYDLDSEAREMDKKASNARSRIQKLRNKLDTQNTRELKSLQSPNTPLSSQEAIRLLNRFAAKDEIQQQQSMKGSVFADTDMEINYLEDLEYQYRDLQKYHQSTIQQVNNAQKQANDAIVAEQKAQERLEQAQRDLMDAQARNHACQKAQFEAVQLEKEAMLDADAIAGRLNQQTEKVRYVLRQREMESMAREARILQQKMIQLEQDQVEYQQQSEELKTQANHLRQQEKES